MTKKKKNIHFEVIDSFSLIEFPKEDDSKEIWNKKQIELQDLMFNNKSAIKKDKAKKYFKQKREDKK